MDQLVCSRSRADRRPCVRVGPDQASPVAGRHDLVGPCAGPHREVPAADRWEVELPRRGQPSVHLGGRVGDRPQPCEGELPAVVDVVVVLEQPDRRVAVFERAGPPLLGPERHGPDEVVEEPSDDRLGQGAEHAGQAVGRRRGVGPLGDPRPDAHGAHLDRARHQLAEGLLLEQLDGPRDPLVGVGRDRGRLRRGEQRQQAGVVGERRERERRLEQPVHELVGAHHATTVGRRSRRPAGDSTGSGAVRATTPNRSQHDLVHPPP